MAIAGIRGTDMRFGKISYKAALRSTIAGAAVAATASAALAGGFEVREQSTHFQGMSFAGAAAGGKSLSSMFWNPAASNYVGKGLTFESNYALILPQSETTITNLAPALAGAGITCATRDCSVDIGREAVVPASYMAVRISPQTVFAMSINSQFGLATQPDNRAWAGAIYNTGAKLFSVNAAPSLSYEVMPGLSIGAGLQIQYLDLQRFQTTTPGALVGAPGAQIRQQLQGDSVDLGYTLGINWRPTPGTSVGLGWRSAITHSLDGEFQQSGLGPDTSTPIGADIDTPDKVTLSLMQDLSPVMRMAATVEWTQWSRAGNIPVTVAATGAPLVVAGRPVTIDLQWDDGWFFALGGEYDYNPNLTLRAGVAYEISPIRDATARLFQLPDADRLWLSLGASYKWSETMTFDIAYSHIFVEDATLIRTTANGNPALVSTATAESSVDILSVGLKSKF